MKNLVLVGFMGCGKSTVGRRVARELDFEFIDTDELIEARSGRSIAEIFAGEGEPHFRQLEIQLMKEMAGRTRLVIASGGGSVLADENWESWKSNGLVVLLDVDSRTAFERTRSHSHRPLLHGEQPLQKIEQLLAARLVYYERADVTVDTRGKTVDEVSAEVFEIYGERAR